MLGNINTLRDPFQPRAHSSRPCTWLAYVIVGTVGLVASAQVSATEDNNAAWTIFTTTNAFRSDDGASRWHYWFDAQARYFDLDSRTNQYLVRPGLGYEINDNLTAWGGYAHLRSRNRAGIGADENRYWQQLTWTAGRWNNGKITMRARLEQRSVSSGDDLGFVLRLNAKYVRPIGDDGKTSLILAVEPFVDLRDTDWGGESGLGQNRSYIGIGWRTATNVTIETGYMNQYIWRDSGENRSNHVAVINFKVKL